MKYLKLKLTSVLAIFASNIASAQTYNIDLDQVNIRPTLDSFEQEIINAVDINEILRIQFSDSKSIRVLKRDQNTFERIENEKQLNDENSEIVRDRAQQDYGLDGSEYHGTTTIKSFELTTHVQPRVAYADTANYPKNHTLRMVVGLSINDGGTGVVLEKEKEVTVRYGEYISTTSSQLPLPPKVKSWAETELKKIARQLAVAVDERLSPMIITDVQKDYFTVFRGSDGIGNLKQTFLVFGPDEPIKEGSNQLQPGPLLGEATVFQPLEKYTLMKMTTGDISKVTRESVVRPKMEQ